MQWCQESDLDAQMADLDAWLDRASGTSAYYIGLATDEAASYVGKYRRFFASWDSGNAPDALKKAVAALAVMEIAAASGNIAPGDLDESVWERKAQRARAFLRDLSTGTADLYVEWGIADDDQGGHRACVSVNRELP